MICSISVFGKGSYFVKEGMIEVVGPSPEPCPTIPSPQVLQQEVELADGTDGRMGR